MYGTIDFRTFADTDLLRAFQEIGNSRFKGSMPFVSGRIDRPCACHFVQTVPCDWLCFGNSVRRCSLALSEIAAAVLYLASPEAGYVTGTTLHVNGGMAML